MLNPAFTFPYSRYDAAGAAVVMYGDPDMTAAGHVNGARSAVLCRKAYG